MKQITVKRILSSKNNLNIYRGCQHGCIYCDSRSDCYGVENFDEGEVKINAIELLDKELKSKRKKVMISFGSMSDPYIPQEKVFKMTHNTLKLCLKYDMGAWFITKSDQVLDDLELIKQVNENTKCVVNMTLTIADSKLSKVIEPNVCDSLRRIEVLKILNANNIPTVVWLGPILPFLTDSEENLITLLNGLNAAKVKYIVFFGFGMTLRDSNREYYYQEIDKYQAGLSNKYRYFFNNDYFVKANNQVRLQCVFKQFCEVNKIEYEIDKVFEYLNTYESKYQVQSLF